MNTDNSIYYLFENMKHDNFYLFFISKNCNEFTLHFKDDFDTIKLIILKDLFI